LGVLGFGELGILEVNSGFDLCGIGIDQGYFLGGIVPLLKFPWLRR
jgi:hypothetical protein